MIFKEVLSGEEIRINRVKNKMKLKDLAAILNISCTQLSNIELGKFNSFQLRHSATQYFSNLQKEKKNETNQEKTN
jgi:transcriptional regulator with XRE-family HTH domain